MEEIAKQITITVSRAAEILAAIIIGLAIIRVLVTYSISIASLESKFSKQNIRVQFGSAVAVGLELMLGADVLATAIAPTWNDIGQLAAIAVIRTALNYFLGKELKEIGNEK